MQRQEGHGDGGVGDFLVQHEGGEAQAEGVIVVSGVPDGDAVGLPGFDGSDGEGVGGNVEDATGEAVASVLEAGEGVELGESRGELEIFLGGRGRVEGIAFTTRRVVEGPVLRVALASLHHGAFDAVEEGGVVGKAVGFGEVEVLFGHAEFRADAVEAELAVGPLEAEGIVGTDLFVAHDPFVHAPEVRVAKVDLEVVNETGDQGEVRDGSDGAADSGRLRRGGAAPGFDVLERLGEIDVLEGVVDADLETGTGHGEDLVGGEARRVFDDRRVEGRVVPPVR